MSLTILKKNTIFSPVFDTLAECTTNPFRFTSTHGLRYQSPSPENYGDATRIGCLIRVEETVSPPQQLIK